MITLRKKDAEPRIDPTAMVKRSKVGSGSVIEKDSVVLSSTIGSNVDIEKRNLLNNATIGDMSYTGADVSITWAEVGKYCCIARMVDIGGNEHNYRAASMMPTYRVNNRLAGKHQVSDADSYCHIAIAILPQDELAQSGRFGAAGDVGFCADLCAVCRMGQSVVLLFPV